MPSCSNKIASTLFSFAKRYCLKLVQVGFLCFLCSLRHLYLTSCASHLFSLEGSMTGYGISWNFKEWLKALSLGGRQRRMGAISKMNSERSGCRERLPVPFSQRKLESASTFPVSLLPPPESVRHKTYSSYNHISHNSLTRQTITLHLLKCGNISVRYMKPLRALKRGGFAGLESRSDAVTGRSERRPDWLRLVYKRCSWPTNKW